MFVELGSLGFKSCLLSYKLGLKRINNTKFGCDTGVSQAINVNLEGCIVIVSERGHFKLVLLLES